MAKTFKVGDKVRILDVDSIKFGNEHWSNGDITEIIGFFGTDNKYPFLKRTKGGNPQSSNHLIPEELHYIELVDANPTKKQRIKALEKANADLVTEVEALKARIEALENGAIKNNETGCNYIASKMVEALKRHLEAEQQTPMSANQRRKAVIERAKAFVADVEKRAEGNRINKDGNSTFNMLTTKPEYHVNKEKRVVTALVKGVFIPELLEKAIARCAPGDVFNEHIGKAIALAKAYGLDCPKEFTDAPQPEIAVGQVVEDTSGYGNYGNGTVSHFESSLGGKQSYRTTDDGWCFVKYAKIVDDSEAQYDA